MDRPAHACALRRAVTHTATGTVVHVYTCPPSVLHCGPTSQQSQVASPGAEVASPGAALVTTEEAAAAELPPGPGEAATDEMHEIPDEIPEEIPDEWRI